MIVNIEVLLRHPLTLPETAICRVEVRDVTLLNERSVTIASHEASVTRIADGTVLTTALEIPDTEPPNRDYTVWVHLSLTGHRQVQAGDFVTKRAYPVKQGEAAVHVLVALEPVSP